MGWNFAKSISIHHDAHVIVETKFKQPLEEYAAQHPDEVKNITFYFVPRTRLRTLRKILPMSYYWTYRTWMKKAQKKTGQGQSTKEWGKTKVKE